MDQDCSFQKPDFKKWDENPKVMRGHVLGWWPENRLHLMGRFFDTPHTNLGRRRDDLHQDTKRHFCCLRGLLLKIVYSWWHAWDFSSKDPFMLVPHQTAFIFVIMKTLIILEHLSICKKVLATPVSFEAFSFIFLQLIFLSQKNI